MSDWGDPNRLLPPPPRAIVMRPVAKIGRVAAWLVVIALLVGGPLWVQRRINRLQTLNDNGRVIQGQILSRRTAKPDQYFLTLAVPSQGRTVKREVEVERDDYYLYKQAIPVETMPGDSSDYEVGPIDDSRIESERKSAYLFLIFGSICLFFVGLTERCIATERKLLRYGEAVMGRVTKRRSFRGDPVISYEFPTRFGVGSGWDTFSRKDGQDLNEGDPIQILYDPKNEKKCGPLLSIKLHELAD